MDSRLAGMDIHLAKPLDEAKMINALKQCIAERSAVKLRNDLLRFAAANLIKTTGTLQCTAVLLLFLCRSLLRMAGCHYISLHVS